MPHTEDLEEKSALVFHRKLGAGTKGSCRCYKHTDGAFSLYLGAQCEGSVDAGFQLSLRLSFVSAALCLARKCHLPLPSLEKGEACSPKIFFDELPLINSV